MTTPDPNLAPYTPAVHQERTLSTTTAASQDAQRGMRGKLIESIMQLVVQAVTGVFLPGPLGAAFTQLSSFFSSILPDQILQPIRDVVDILVGALDSIPIIGPPIGNAVEDLAAMFGLLNNKTAVAQATGTNAQSSADNANVGVSQLNAQLQLGDVVSGGGTGTYFTDTFGRTGSNLGSSYTQFDSGPGGGTFTTDGNNAVIVAAGTATTECVAYINPGFVTDYQSIAMVQDASVPSMYVSPLIRLILRCNPARTNYVVLTIMPDSAELGKVVGGTYTALQTITSHPNSPGDLWTFKAGTTANIRELIVVHGVQEVLRTTDTAGTTHTVGASNRNGAFTEATGQILIPPFFTQVASPPAIQSITINDRLAAA